MGNIVHGIAPVAVGAADGEVEHLQAAELVELYPEAPDQFAEVFARHTACEVGLPVRPAVLVEPPQSERRGALPFLDAFDQERVPDELERLMERPGRTVGRVGADVGDRLQLLGACRIGLALSHPAGSSRVPFGEMRSRSDRDGHRLPLGPLLRRCVRARFFDISEDSVVPFGKQAREIRRQVAGFHTAGEHACAYGRTFLVGVNAERPRVERRRRRGLGRDR